MKPESKIKKFFASLKQKKNLEILIALIAVVILLIVYFSSKISSGKKEQEDTVQHETYCEKTENSIVSALKSMQGVGKVKIAVNWECGVEKIIAYSTSGNGNNVNTTPTVIQSQGSSSPIILKEVYPKALGVVIICEGGNDIAVKLNVINAVSTLLDIPPNKVNVYAMK